jgi:hypothetical protein
MENVKIYPFIHTFIIVIRVFRKKGIREWDISSFHIYECNLTSALKMPFEQLNPALNLDSQHNYGKMAVIAVATLVKKLLAEMHANNSRSRL